MRLHRWDGLRPWPCLPVTPAWAPAGVSELVAMIAQAAGDGLRLEIRGGGSKAAMGLPGRTATILDMRGFAGVVDYDPPELVLTAGAGTKLGEIEALVAARGQMLAFEPFDHGTVFGAAGGAATLGGIVAAGVAGGGRVSAGGARDHLLGFTAVSGRGERFVAGGRVVKNVTGYDLSKLVAGSWGRLVALTEVTLKVLPAPRETVLLALAGLEPAAAYQAMAQAMGAPAEVSAAFHLPAERAGGSALTVLRVQGFGPSVAARRVLLTALLEPFGRLVALATDVGDAAWQAVRTLAPLAGDAPLWRLSVPARGFPGVVQALAPCGIRWLADWAGSLVWVTGAAPAAAVRAAAVAAGGHAMLVRGDAAVRASVPMLQPQPAALAALERRVRRAFDPAGVFETGRFDAGRVGEDADAD